MAEVGVLYLVVTLGQALLKQLSCYFKSNKISGSVPLVKMEFVNEMHLLAAITRILCKDLPNLGFPYI